MKNKRLYVVILCLIMIIVIVSMNIYVSSNLKKEFASEYANNVRVLQKELTYVDDFLEIYGNLANDAINENNLYDDFQQLELKNIVEYFVYDEERDIFHLDELTNSGLNLSRISNITGRGNFDFLKDKENIKSKEIYLSVLMNEKLYALSNKISASHWVYYTSLNNLISIRKTNQEFVSSEEFHYIDELLDMNFLTGGTKDNLPNRNQVFWSHPYVDLGGAGLIITASYPVDYKEKYIGSISVDFKSEILNELLSDKYTTFLADEDGTVIAINSDNIDLGTRLINIDELPINLKYKDLVNLEHDELHSIKGSFVFNRKIEGTPYEIYQLYPHINYYAHVFFDMIPILIISVLFIGIGIIFLKVRKSEEQLRETLNALESKQDELDYISRFDTLTNVFNRRGLYGVLDKLEIEKSIYNACLIIIDIDYFKHVNDKFGHNVGDSVLTELCKVINTCVSNDEIVSRYGGEEFVIVSRTKELEEAVCLAEEIRIKVMEHYFETIEKITISIGIAKHGELDSRNDWFKNADDALYKAKELGRNTTCYYENPQIKSLKK